MTYQHFSPHTGPAPDQPAAIPEPPKAPCTLEEALASPLSGFADCRLAVVCGCERPAGRHVEALLNQVGDMPVGKVIGKLRCRACGQRPGSIYLQGFPEGVGRQGWAIRLSSPR